jgi:hypothetical protein
VGIDLAGSSAPPRLAFKAVAKTMEAEVRAIDRLGAAMET